MRETRHGLFGGRGERCETREDCAVYDATVAIEGGYRAYAAAIRAPRGANVRAAVTTAAFGARVLVHGGHRRRAGLRCWSSRGFAGQSLRESGRGPCRAD